MRTWIVPLAAAVAVSGCATSPTETAVPADPVIAAERAFAARGSEVPVKQAFLDFAAPDGVLVSSAGGARNARDVISGWPDRDDAGYIKWWPVFAGISADGGLGFTTGPAVYGDNAGFSNYFTVWRKQPDGSWRWMIDTGVSMPGPSAEGRDAPVRVVAAASGRRAPPTVALPEMDAADTAFAAEAAADAHAAYGAAVADDARVLGILDAPATGRAAIQAALAQRPAAIAFERLGSGTAASGDLGWTYGRASYEKDGAAVATTFVRVWRRDREGWRIVGEAISR